MAGIATVGDSQRRESDLMMNHNGWMGGGGMWLWAVLITALVVAMLVIVLNKRSSNK